MMKKKKIEGEEKQIINELMLLLDISIKKIKG